MKLKNKIALGSMFLRLLFLLVFWFTIPAIVKHVIYKNIEKTSLEKRDLFKKDINSKNVDNIDIQDFIERKDSDEIFANFTTLHSEFLQFYQSKSTTSTPDNFVDEDRILDHKTFTFRVLYHDFTYNKAHYILEIGKNIEEIDELITSLHYFLLLFMVVTLVLNHFAQTIFVNYLLKPFQKLIDTKISKENQPETFDFTTTNSSTTDFIALDEGLNSMMHRIQGQFKNEKQFIANVSHELLTPISILKNRFENLLNNPSLNDEAMDKVALSLKNLNNLKRIINNLLLLSRIENNQYSTFERLQLKSQIADITTDLEDQIEIKQITIINNLTHDYQFKGNKALIHILFYNIIINALKFTTPQDIIRLYDNMNDGIYSISIQDSGIGMTTEQTKNIFDRFIKINIDQEGQGLGLAIAASIANLHNIEIQVQSILHEGSTFTFLFRK
ncbi:hypothetical protein FFWV33_00520 [Flavobacterium faecale]|uniref:histidine kinase n=1 Tax=Flavobacterium faecale TaxID=1355330 RepID=A0A2S1L8Q2_9FLAO|nr:HAMP domain-containing sensor histidine kinase [Flavobacterium faecale]AWG20107.1 hypothetical protein FFWV33_00520 [Flavobacterium faecale]